MSWNMNIMGAAQDVAAEVDKDQHLPQPLKDAVKLFADANSKASPTAALSVVSSGHYSPDGYSYLFEFKILMATIAPPSQPVAAETPAAVPASNGS